MVVAVTFVRVMQVPLDQVIEVFAVGDRGVAAARPVLMIAAVTVAAMVRGATVRIGVTDREPVLIHVIAVHMVQMTIVKVVGMTLVRDGGMAAGGAVGVGMVLMGLAAQRALLCFII